jgi:hypothetical protein
MKKLALAAVAVAAAVLCVVSTASADLVSDLQGSLDALVAWDPGFAPFAADPPPDGHEFVVGSQKTENPFAGEYQLIRVSAHSLPGGVDPKGQVEVTYHTSTRDIDLMADVDCLNVGPGTGVAQNPGQTEADVDAVLREPYMGNTHVTLIIIDNGDPGPTMGHSPDLVFWALTNFPPPHNCANYGGSVLPLDSTGNYVAHDVVE